FRLLVMREVPPARPQRRFFWVTGIGIVGVLEAGIAAFLLRGEDALQLPFSRFLYGDLSPLAQGTRFGQTFVVMELGFALFAALRRFSRVATVLVALLLSAGTYLSILRLPHMHDLWTTGYGHVLLLKLGLVCLALGWGAAHHFLAVPRIERPGVTGTLARTLVGESAV